ncbi:hypothetical protein N8787_03175 [Opitutaceae bacterium]|nr:hypothetical protein [Opitutaceae bacterium]
MIMFPVSYKKLRATPNSPLSAAELLQIAGCNLGQKLAVLPDFFVVLKHVPHPFQDRSESITLQTDFVVNPATILLGLH